MFWGESAVEGLCRNQRDMAEIIAGYLTRYSEDSGCMQKSWSK